MAYLSMALTKNDADNTSGRKGEGSFLDNDHQGIPDGVWAPQSSPLPCESDEIFVISVDVRQLCLNVGATGLFRGWFPFSKVLS